MDIRQNKLNWTTMLWSVTLLCVIPRGLAFLINVGYGTIVGLQTHGDWEMIDQILLLFFQTFWYQALPFVPTVFVAIGRGLILKKQVRGNIKVHIIVAVVLARFLAFVIGFVVFQHDISAIVPNVAIELGLCIGCALAVVYLRREQHARAQALRQAWNRYRRAHANRTGFGSSKVKHATT